MELLDSDAPHRNDDRGPEAAPGAHPHWIASLLSEATRLDVTLLENADRSFRRRGERPRRFTCERTRAPSISASPSSSQVYSLAGRFSRADELSATSMSRVRRHRQTEDDRAYVGTTASRRSFTELHKVRGIEQIMDLVRATTGVLLVVSSEHSRSPSRVIEPTTDHCPSSSSRAELHLTCDARGERVPVRPIVRRRRTAREAGKRSVCVGRGLRLEVAEDRDAIEPRRGGNRSSK